MEKRARGFVLFIVVILLVLVAFAIANNYGLFGKGITGNVVSSSGSTCTNGLVGYWKFNENSSSAMDYAGNNTGELVNGPVKTDGLFGSSLYLSGSPYLKVKCTKDFPSKNKPWTQSAWINVGPYSQARGIIQFGNSTAGAKYHGTQFDINPDGTITLNIPNIGGPTSNGKVDDNQWHFVVAVYDGKTTSLYIDGVKDISGNYKPSVDCNNFYIGANQDSRNGITNLFFGQIDEVSLWNRALSADEIQSRYNSGYGKDSCNQNDLVPLPTKIALMKMDNACFNDLKEYISFDGSYDDLSQNKYKTKIIDVNLKAKSTLTLVGDKNGKAFYFDGKGKYFNLDKNILNGKSNFTVSLWVNSVDKKETVFYALNSHMIPEFSISNLENLSVILKVTGANPKGTIVNLGTALNDGNWHNIIVSVDILSSLMEVYVDGNPQTPVSILYSAKLSKTPLNLNGGKAGIYLGAQPLSFDSTNARNRINWKPYKGFVDELAITDKYLTAEEASDWYKYGVCFSSTEKAKILSTTCNKDNGDNPYLQGKISGLLDGRVANDLQDFCFSDKGQAEALANAQLSYDSQSKSIDVYYNTWLAKEIEAINGVWAVCINPSPPPNSIENAQKTIATDILTAHGQLDTSFNDFKVKLEAARPNTPILGEFYCADNNNIGLKFYSCDGGCKNGICLGPSKDLSQTLLRCISHDKEDDPFLDGSTTISINGQSSDVKDTCISQDVTMTENGKQVKKTQSYLTEYYCTGNDLSYKVYQCSSGCDSTGGACLQ